MSFNRRGGFDRRPDRPPRPGPRGGYGPRDAGPRQEGGERPYGARPPAGRRFDRPPDDGGMTLRLDPRRLRALKDLAGEAGVRPGDLARRWVEERIDAERTGAGGISVDDRLSALEARIAALEGAGQMAAAAPAPGPAKPEPEQPTDVATEPQDAEAFNAAPTAEAEPAPKKEPAAYSEAGAEPTPRRRGRVSAAPSARVALHDEMTAVLVERGPMTAAELAAAIAERGRYAPPRSGKPLDAAMVSQRASNPAYRSRFVRREGRIGLAEAD